MKKIISIHEPSFIGNEKKYINLCIDEGWVSTNGRFIKKFENKISKYVKSKYSIILNSCTSALHLSLILLDVKPYDEVIVPTITFISPINTVLYNYSFPIFMDTDEFFNIDVNKTLEFLMNQTFTKKINNINYTFNIKTNRRIAAIIVVHTFGNPANIFSLIKICKEKNIKIIEDAAEGLGSFIKYNNFYKHLGTIGDIGCISFNGNKIITSGGGGAILTNNKKIYDKANHLCKQSKTDSVNFKHDQVGFNYRMTNIQAAIGLAQIENVSKYLKRKKEIHDLYKKYLSNSSIFLLKSFSNNSKTNYWINILSFKKNKVSKNKIFQIFRKNSIQTRSIWYPNHLNKHLKKFQRYKITKSLNYFNTSVCLPSSFSLKNNDIKNIINCLNTFD